MKRLALIAMSAALAVGSAFAAGNADLDIDKVNGSIHVPDNATVGKLSTVNGSIHVGDGAHAVGATTVNGSIHHRRQRHAGRAGHSQWRHPCRRRREDRQDHRSGQRFDHARHGRGRGRQGFQRQRRHRA